ncbi:MAG: CHAT domain-containing tetratricopeptide repeat protein [Caldilineaceae bacterium]
MTDPIAIEQTDREQWLRTFFGALYSRKFSECQTLIDEWRNAIPPTAPEALWADYLTGVLTNERDHDAPAAEQIFQSVLAAHPVASLSLRTLKALGIMYDAQSRWLEAIDAFKAILAATDAPALTIEDRAGLFKNIALCCEKGYAYGALDADYLAYAERCCHEALALLASVSAHPAELAWVAATTQSALGLVYKHQQRWAEALACHQQRLAYAQQEEDAFGMAVAYDNLGEIYQLQGQATWPDALTAYQAALAIFQRLDHPFNTVEVLANLAALHQAMGSFSAAMTDYQAALALAEQVRAGVTSESGRVGYFATVEAVYANAVLLAVQLQDLPTAFALTEQARARAFLDTLAAGSPQLARINREPVITLAQVQAGLADDAMLLAYFTTGLLEWQVQASASPSLQNRHRFPQETTLLFAITRDQVQCYDLALSPNLVRPGHLTSVVERHFLAEPVRRTLFTALLKPVATLLQEKRIVYLLPHGPLHYIPFQSLLAADGAPLLRPHSAAFVYAPSATILLSKATTKSATAAGAMLCLGYDRQGAYQLRYAEAEARALAQQVGGLALTGAQSKKLSLYSLAGTHRLVHFSCHGAFVPEMPLASFLELAPDETLTALEIMEKLVLNADLVTLSACESGLSRVRHGDELVGLLRAFFYAGARTLLATLWRVDERATYLLMHRFYAQVYNGQDFATALKDAQLYLQNLTYGEAQRLLQRYAPTTAQPVVTPATATAAPWAGQDQGSALMTRGYVKGAPDERMSEPAREPAADAKIFADPRYWAPFVLFAREIGHVSADPGAIHSAAPARSIPPDRRCESL